MTKDLREEASVNRRKSLQLAHELVAQTITTQIYESSNSLISVAYRVDYQNLAVILDNITCEISHHVKRNLLLFFLDIHTIRFQP